MTTATAPSVPAIILQQMGGANRLKMLAGLRSYTGDETTLYLGFPVWDHVDNGKFNSLSIRLEPNDTYTMTFWYQRGLKKSNEQVRSGVYCDQLIEVFESVTGVYITMR